MATLVEQGLKFHDAGELDRAEQCYRDAVAADAMNAVALKLLAVLSAERGRSDDAMSYAQAAIDQKPEVAEYHHLLGRLRARAENFAGAAEALERAATRSTPPSARILCDLGLCYQRTDRFPDAERVYTDALAVDEKSVNAMLGLALCALAAGQLEKAEGLYERILGIEPTHVAAREGLEKVEGWLLNKP